MTQSNLQHSNDQADHAALTTVFQMMRGSSFSSMVSPLVVVMVMWSKIDHSLLIGWAMLIIAGLIVQYLLSGSFLKQDVSLSDAKMWGRRLSALFAYFATLWATTVFLFFADGAMEHQLFILTMVVTLSIWTIVSGQYWLPTFYLFAPITLGAVIARLIIEGEMANYALAAILLWVGLTTLLVAKNLNKTVRSEMRLRHESVLLNAELEKKVEEARQATRSKSKFLAAASHDLRQPLHSLTLFLDVLKDTALENERKEIFHKIDASLDALRKLFDALLNISKLDAGVVKPDISHFNIAEIVNGLKQEFDGPASEKNLKLKTHARSLIVVSDRMLLERILRNLMSNAIRYTYTGGVLLSCRRRGNEVLIQVWDTGIGIPKENNEQIFAEFQQLHNSHRDREEGIGLGLSLVRRLCQLLGHPLELSSVPEKGSIFSIRCPIGSDTQAADRRSTKRAHRWELTGRRVLVIDDEKDILQAMKILLSKWGCEVITAESLDDALKQLTLNKFVPEIILSDLSLRDSKTGIDAIHALRNQYGALIPAVLITGDTSTSQLKLAEQSQLEMLQKPLRPMHLRSVIHHYLSDL